MTMKDKLFKLCTEWNSLREKTLYTVVIGSIINKPMPWRLHRDQRQIRRIACGVGMSCTQTFACGNGVSCSETFACQRLCTVKWWTGCKN